MVVAEEQPEVWNKIDMESGRGLWLVGGGVWWLGESSYDNVWFASYFFYEVKSKTDSSVLCGMRQESETLD